MRLTKIIFFALICLSFTTGMSAQNSSMTLVYSGNLDGELEPCGCSEGGNKGGIKRRVKKVDELRAENPDLILLSTGGLIVSDMPQDRLKSEYILKGLSALNYDAIGVQWQDLSFGLDFLSNSGIPFVISNWNDEKFNTQKVIRRDDIRLAYFQWLDPESDPQMQMGQSQVSKDKNALLQQLKKAKQQGQITALATTLTLKNIQSQFALNDVDILFIQAQYEKIGEPQMIGSTLVLQPGSRGMRLGRAEIQLSNNKIKSFQHEIYPLPPEVGDAERMTAWYQEYNDKVKADYEKRVEIRKQMESGESPYAGEQVCKSCHAKEHETWFNTRHAEAFYALQDVNKAFDPDCIGCHTVGFEKNGGFIDPQITAHLTHVQCESCHGGAKKHADSGGQIKTENNEWAKAQMCAQCHVQKHSPDFVLEKYWPKIAHGKK